MLQCLLNVEIKLKINYKKTFHNICVSIFIYHPYVLTKYENHINKKYD
jgi:hypothetical protein